MRTSITCKCRRHVMKRVLLAIVGIAVLSTAGLLSAQNTPSAPAPEPQSQQPPPADAQPSQEAAPAQPAAQAQPASSTAATPAAGPNSVAEKHRIAPGSVIPVQLTKTVD